MPQLCERRVGWQKVWQNSVHRHTHLCDVHALLRTLDIHERVSRHLFSDFIIIFSKLSTLCIGIALGGIGGALINNNSTPAMIHTEIEERTKSLRRQPTNKEKEKLYSIVSAINTGSFGLGAIVGPILGSVLTDLVGYRTAFTIGGGVVFLLSFFHLASQFCYTRNHSR